MKRFKLSDVMVIKYGKDHKKLANGVFPLYGSGGIMRYVERSIYDEESILIPRKGSLNNLFYIDQPFWTVDTVFWSKINRSLAFPKYLYYLLKTYDLASLNVGSAVPSLTTEILNKVEICLPDLPTQKAIAEILSSLDDKIELNNEMNKTLDELAQTLFKRWFVDFEFPDENGNPYKSSGGEMVESELGFIPKGWRITILDEVVDVKGGTTPSTSVEEYWNGEYYWTTPKDLSNSQAPVLISTDRKLTELGVKQISSGILPVGTLLLSSRAPIGYLAITQVPISINQGYIAVHGKMASNLFMLYWLKENMDLVKSKANGSTFQEISKSNFKMTSIILPSDLVLLKFDEILNPIFQQITKNVYSNRDLANIRDLLLPKLMSGQIEV